MARTFLLAVAVLIIASRGSAQDFNSDGFIDTVIGVPGEDVGGRIDAGAVDVIYGGGHSAPLAPQHWTMDSAGVPGSPGDGDTFGFAVAWGRFNQDNYDDLAIGIPGRNWGGVTRAGAVLIIYGGAYGLVADPA